MNENSATLERSRISEIVNFLEPIGEHGLAVALIADPKATVADARRIYMLSQPTRRSPALGLSRGEITRYSLARVLESITHGSPLSGLERDVHKELERLHGAASKQNGVLVPPDVFADVARRDLQAAGAASAGGYLVETAPGPLGFVELARSRMVTGALGAEVAEGLVGNVTLPRTSTGVTTQFLTTEATATTESTPVLGVIAMTPKTVATSVEMSRQMALQTSPAAQRFIGSELLSAVAAAVDDAALNGSGAAGQPSGLLAQLTPASGTSFAIAHVQAAEAGTDAGVTDNASMGWATTPTVARLLQTRLRVASTYSPIWTGSYLDGAVHDNRARSSTRMPAGVAVFGDWRSMVIGSWGVIELAANPYANFAAGIIGLRCMLSFDVAVRRLNAFASVSAIT